jgi:alanine racemase
VTLIGGQIGVDEVAAAANSASEEVLCHIGSRFRRFYHAS